MFELADVENPTIHDLAKNPHNYTLIESEAAIIPVQLPDVDIAVINGNYALDHGLNPAKMRLQSKMAKTTHTQIFWRGRKILLKPKPLQS